MAAANESNCGSGANEGNQKMDSSMDSNALNANSSSCQGNASISYAQKLKLGESGSHLIHSNSDFVEINGMLNTNINVNVNNYTTSSSLNGPNNSPICASPHGKHAINANAAKLLQHNNYSPQMNGK